MAEKNPNDCPPCTLVARLEERADAHDAKFREHEGWLTRLNGEVSAFRLSVTADLAELKTKMLFMGGLGAIVGSALGTIVAALVIWKITGR